MSRITVKQVQKENERLEGNITELVKELKVLRGKHTKLQNKYDADVSKLAADVIGKNNQAKSDIAALKKQVINEHDNYSKYYFQAHKLKNKVRSLKGSLTKLKSSASAKEIEHSNKIRDLKNTVRVLEDQNDYKYKELVENAEKIGGLQDTIVQLNSELADAVGANENFEKQNTHAEVAFEVFLLDVLTMLKSLRDLYDLKDKSNKLKTKSDIIDEFIRNKIIDNHNILKPYQKQINEYLFNQQKEENPI